MPAGHGTRCFVAAVSDLALIILAAPDASLAQRWSQTPAHKRQLTSRLFRILADDGDGLGRSNVVSRNRSHLLPHSRSILRQPASFAKVDSAHTQL